MIAAVAYQLTEIVPKSVLTLRVADADTGAPRRMSVHTGEALLTSAAGGVRVITGLLPREACALFVPDVRPLEPHGGVPDVQAEVYLCGVVVDGNVQRQAGYGVGDAMGSFEPDPRGGPLRWLRLSFTVTTLVAVRAGYRVTVLSPA